jgi:hypothetical protein
VRRLAATILAAALALAPAGAEARRGPAKRPEVVCFKKTVWVPAKRRAGAATRRGRMVRKTVCRARRKAAPAKAFDPAVPPVPDVAPAAPAASTSAPVAAAPVAAALVAAAAPPVVVCPDDSPWVGATAEDAGGVFRLRLTRSCVRAGTVLFDVRNRDLQPHDLWVRAPGAAPRPVVAEVAPEQGAQGSAPLTAGEWTLFCSIDGHESMTRALTVTPAG